MKALTKEWIKKAEKDVGTARRESRVEIDTNWDAVCANCVVDRLIIDKHLIV